MARNNAIDHWYRGSIGAAILEWGRRALKIMKEIFLSSYVHLWSKADMATPPTEIEMASWEDFTTKRVAEICACLNDPRSSLRKLTLCWYSTAEIESIRMRIIRAVGRSSTLHAFKLSTARNQHLRVLCENVKYGTVLQELVLHVCDAVDCMGLLCASPLLKSPGTLKILNFWCEPGIEPSDAAELGRMLTENSTLEKLTIGPLDRSDGVEQIIMKPLTGHRNGNTSLKHLELQFSGGIIGSKGVDAIAKALSTNRTLVHFTMGSGGLEEHHVFQLLKSLERNTTLEVWDLKYCRGLYTKKVSEAFMDLLTNYNFTLKSVNFFGCGMIDEPKLQHKLRENAVQRTMLQETMRIPTEPAIRPTDLSTRYRNSADDLGDSDIINQPHSAYKLKEIALHRTTLQDSGPSLLYAGQVGPSFMQSLQELLRGGDVSQEVKEIHRKVDKMMAILVDNVERQCPSYVYFTDPKRSHKLIVKLLPKHKALRLHFLCERRDGSHVIPDQEGATVSIAPEQARRIILPLIVATFSVFAAILKTATQVGAGMGDLVANVGTKVALKYDSSTLSNYIGDQLPSSSTAAERKGELAVANQWLAHFLKGKKISEAFKLFRVRYLDDSSIRWVCRRHRDEGCAAGILREFPVPK